MKYVAALVLVMSCGFAIKGFGIGPTGGIHMGNVYGDATYDWGYRTGLNGGIVITQTVAGFLDGSTNLIYIQKGAEYTADIGVPFTITMVFDYFEAPMVMRFHIPTKSSVIPEFLFGAALAIPIKIAMRMESSSGTSEVEYPDNMTESLELSAFAGLGIRFVLPFGKILLDARYSGGATPVFITDDFHNQGLTLSLGYVVP